MAAVPAFSQNALTNRGAWVFANLPDYLVNPADVSGASKDATTVGGASGVGRQRAAGTVTQNGADTQSVFTVGTTGTQTFTLTTQSVVQLPVYLNGAINFFGAPNNSSGFVRYTLQIKNAANTVVYNDVNTFGRTGAAPVDGRNNSLALKTVTLPAGNYTLGTEFIANGQTRLTVPPPASAPGSGVIVDFSNPGIGFRGAAVTLGGWATDVGDSRANIRAPGARADYHVDGANVSVGVLELGRTYLAGDGNVSNPNDTNLTNVGLHADFAAAGKITLLNNAELSKAQYRDEHTQAVASIIAGDNGDAAKAGIAPKAKLVVAGLSSYPAAGGATPRRFVQAVNDMVAAHCDIVNMSATTYGGPNGPGQPAEGSDPNGDSAFLDTTIVANPNLLFVVSSGNTGNNTGRVTAPATAYNGFAIGSLDRNFAAIADYSSSWNNLAGLRRAKPDLVAPGDQILVASAVSTAHTRAFLGENLASPDVGTVRGTSFSAPHVAGVAALMHQVYDGDLLGHSFDHRLVKAVMMNTATRAGLKRSDGATPWTQGKSGSLTAADPLVVFASTDAQLGAGSVDASAALRGYAPGEVQIGASVDGLHDTIDVPAGTKTFWDTDVVSHGVAAPPVATEAGTIDYLLGSGSGALRATLVWDAKANGTLPELELRLYREADEIFNPAGFDDRDDMLATTKYSFDVAGDTYYANSAIFDFTLPPRRSAPTSASATRRGSDTT